MMKNRILIAVTLLIFIYYAQAFSWSDLNSFLKNPLKRASPGDILYQKCSNLTLGGQSIKGACVTLSESADCGVNVTLTVAGTLIFSQDMDVELAPQVCGTYSTGSISCDICIDLNLSTDGTSGSYPIRNCDPIDPRKR